MRKRPEKDAGADFFSSLFFESNFQAWLKNLASNEHYFLIVLCIVYRYRVARTCFEREVGRGRTDIVFVQRETRAEANFFKYPS